MDILKMTDGCGLQWQALAATQNVRGQVLLVHGLGEHMGRYEALAMALQGAGWQVLAYDQRGHGGSEGARGVMPAAHSLLDDLGAVIDAVRDPALGPLVLLGHSLGGLVAARYVAEALQVKPARWCRPVDGLVLSSPALDAGMSPVQKLLTAVVSRVAPNLAVNNGLDPAWISTDPEVVAAYQADPLVHDRISGRLARFIAETGPEVLALAPVWRLPTLLLWAGADRCVRPAGSARFAELAPKGCVQSQVWPEMAHEIFNEPARDEVVAALLRWLSRP
jgi:alpha-beta hydrolase superfamily lysophospholipase